MGNDSQGQPRQNYKEYTDSSSNVVSFAVILQNHRSLSLGECFHRLSWAVPQPSSGSCILSFLPEGLISGWNHPFHFPYLLGMRMSRVGLLILARISISPFNSIILCISYYFFHLSCCMNHGEAKSPKLLDFLPDQPV